MKFFLKRTSVSKGPIHLKIGEFDQLFKLHDGKKKINKNMDKDSPIKLKDVF